jgi:hypothetical protein
MKFAGKPVGFWEKGNISNMITFAILIVGLVLRALYDRNTSNKLGAEVGKYFLAFGLFGFAGGVTNWLAVKMLFEDMPAKGSRQSPNRRPAHSNILYGGQVEGHGLNFDHRSILRRPTNYSSAIRMRCGF